MLPIAPTLPTASAPSAAAVTLVAEAVPPALQTQAQGTPVRAHVLDRLAGDRTRLATPFGTVVVRSPVPLPLGKTLGLTVTASNGTVSLRWLPSAAGPDQHGASALDTSARAPAQPAAPTAPSVPTRGTIAAPSWSPGQTVTATLLAGGTAAPSGFGQTRRVDIGAEQVAMPQRAAKLAVRLWATSNEASAGRPPAAAPPRLVPAQVLHSRDGGRPMVQTPTGVLALDLATQPSAGTRLTMELLGPAPPIAHPIASAADAEANGASALNTPLAALDEAATLMAASRTTKSVSPKPPTGQPGGQLAATLLLALSAIGSGDSQRPVGEKTARVLERLRPGLPGRLADDMAAAIATAEDRQGGQWRTMAVPIFMGERHELVQIRIRERSSRDQKGGRSVHTARFVLEIDLSTLGRIQLDALVGERGRRLDLLVRAHSRLPDWVRSGIDATFQSVQGRIGLSGSVGFSGEPVAFDLVSDRAPGSGIIV